MALVGEMQYLTIGGNTYSLPSGNEGTVTSVGVGNATNGGLTVSGSPITSSGTITIGHMNVLTSAQSTLAVYPIKIDKNGHISEYGSAISIPTKVSDLTNDSGFITGYTETDPIFSASAAAGITSSDITSWNNKVSDDKTWNGVVLDTSGGMTGFSSVYVPARSQTTGTTAYQMLATSTPTSCKIAMYDNSAYLKSTTPSANDNSTKVATTAYVDAAIPTVPTNVSAFTNDAGYLTSYTETDPTVPSWAKASSKPSYTASEVGALPANTSIPTKISDLTNDSDFIEDTLIGAANGIAPLDSNSLISSTYLPSYVDDVLEYATRAGFPPMGETGKIYVDTDTNKTYRWGGSEYVEISASLAIGKTSSTAAAGNHTHSVSITPSTTDVYSMTSAGSVTAGTKASFTPGSFSGGSLIMSINGSDSGQLDITFTAATHGSDSFTQNTPTSVTLPGRSSAIAAWTGYSSATAQAQT